ncbi:MAG: tetratricopeptide repeat protein [Roseiflexaceae bacterium]|nr:tetratricopeptide repeat protein [Roseiflexaceae bacterium]
MIDTSLEPVTLLLVDTPAGAPHFSPPSAAQQRQAIEAILRACGGMVFSLERGVFGATFVDNRRAVEAAQRVQQRVLGSGDRPLDLPRVSLHRGVVYSAHARPYGATVDRALQLLAAGQSGQILLSRAASEQARQGLPAGTQLQDLGMHRLADLLRPEQIAHLVDAENPRPVLPLVTTLDSYPNNLPIQATPLVGRNQHIAEIYDILLDPEVRMLTLTGMGGTGKTRLAVHASAALLEAFPDGAYLVALSPVTNPLHVMSTVAHVLGIVGASEQQIHERVLNDLRDKQVLLVLDNFEHVLAAVPVVSDLLAEAAGLKIIVTSREPLHLYGEREYAVPPLALPDAQAPASIDQLLQYEAVRLFVERARAVKNGFTLNAANAPTIVELCRRLDGLPLSIELAAARVKLLSPAALLARLSELLDVLIGGARNLPSRQQSLRNMIDWSFNLLSAEERVVFCRLGVFVGGFSIDAAEQILWSLSGGEQANLVHRNSLLDLLASLLDKSLLRQDEAEDSPRFSMLETIHLYAVEQLASSGEQLLLAEHHASYFCELVEHAKPGLQGLDRRVWLGRLDQEYANIRSALDWSFQHNRLDLAGRMAAELWPYWYGRGLISEGRTWLEQALASAEVAPPPLHAKLLHGAGTLAMVQGEYARAQELLDQSLELGRAHGDLRHVITVLNNLGTIATHQGTYAQAQERYAESLSLARPLDDNRLLAGTLGSAGLAMLQQGRYDEAHTLYQESLELLRELGATETIARSLTELGAIARYQGNYAGALALHEESLSLGRELGYLHGIARTLIKIGTVARLQGEWQRATASYGEALELARSLSDKLSIAEGLEGLASIASMHGHSDRGIVLWGAAESVRDAIHAPVPLADRAEYSRLIAAARGAMGDAVFTALWTSGRSMTPEQLQSLPAPVLPVSAAKAPLFPAELTEREVEVLRLIAQGLTDVQVADKLVISPRTVNSHLRTIYSKIEVTSRTAAARFAHTHGLL